MNRKTLFQPNLHSLAAIGLLCWLAFSSISRPSLADDESKSAQGATLSEKERRAEATKTFVKNVDPFVQKYCIDCHGPRPEAGINLRSALNSPGNASSFLHWKKAVANVRVKDMPPAYADAQPSDTERKEFIEWIGKLKYIAARDPGPFVIRKLSKLEYSNTLHDLYGVKRSIADSLPAEVLGEGYLNSISPMQSELFLEVANKVVDEIVAPNGQRPTEVQLRLFGQEPSNASEYRRAARIVAFRIARQAYRRPAMTSEIDVLLDVFDLGRENNLSYSDSLGLMLKAVLVSPQFLFITPSSASLPREVWKTTRSTDAEAETTNGAKAAIVPLDNYQLASRLSYLIWASPPDRQLSQLADEGKLQDPDVLRQQAERLLADPRSRALFDGFGAQWLQIDDLENQVFDPQTFPSVSASLLKAMYEEARLFFESVVHENHPVSKFIQSDYTFLNESLAELYEIDGPVKGAAMHRVKLNDPNRGGILGMPAALAATSFPNRTSPVRRGVWVLEQILGERVPPPPPDVPELEEQKDKNLEGLTLRQRTELHQSEATCANCHRILDPIGFGLENFNAIGRWREKNNEGIAIDSEGQLPSGERFASPADLKQILLKRESDIARNLTERFMAYSLGRQLEGYDEVIIDQLMESIAQDNNRFRTILTEVITSYLFTHRRVRELP